MGKWRVTCASCREEETWEADTFFDAQDKFPPDWGYDQVLKGSVCPKCKIT